MRCSAGALQPWHMPLIVLFPCLHHLLLLSLMFCSSWTADLCLCTPLHPLPHCYFSCSQSPLYSGQLKAANYYNTTSGSPDINPRTGAPYGFFYYNLDGTLYSKALALLLHSWHRCALISPPPFTDPHCPFFAFLTPHSDHLHGHAGIPAGYPVVVNNHVSQQRTAQLVQYMRDGGYLNPQLTDTLTMTVSYGA